MTTTITTAVSKPDCFPADFVSDASGLDVTPAAMLPDSSLPCTTSVGNSHAESLVHQCTDIACRASHGALISVPWSILSVKVRAWQTEAPPASDPPAKSD